MTARDRLRWAAPALLAAAMPLASRLVVWRASTGLALTAALPSLVVQAVWAAMPFAALAVLAVATRRTWAEVRLAMGAGLVLTAALWGWASREGVLVVTGQQAEGLSTVLQIVRAGAPVAVLSVMVTAAAVRAAFGGRPARPSGRP